MTVEKNFSGVPEDETFKMGCGNVVEFFHFEDCVLGGQPKHVQRNRS